MTLVKPVVTIGVCVRNSASTIREAIESIIGQDFPHELMELIIVDGFSQDETLKIIRESLENADMQSNLFYENEGLGRARQIVVDNASGEYIVWVDGDMVLSKDFVSEQVEFMKQHLDVGIVKGRYGSLANDRHENLVALLENVEFMLNTMLEGETNSKVLGTSGCIYRVKAIREVGGFDVNIKGVGEDMDAEDRLRSAGWKLYTSSAIFYETRRQTWRSLWNEYFWHGRGGSVILKKNKLAINMYNIIPPVALVTELFRVPAAYQLTRRKAVLFLPFHWTFKRIAWCLGFAKSHMKRHGHASQPT